MRRARRRKAPRAEGPRTARALSRRARAAAPFRVKPFDSLLYVRSSHVPVRLNGPASKSTKRKSTKSSRRLRRHVVAPVVATGRKLFAQARKARERVEDLREGVEGV